MTRRKKALFGGIIVLMMAVLAACAGKAGNTGTTSTQAPGEVAVQEAQSDTDGSYSVQEIDVQNDGQNIYGEAYIPNRAGSENRVPLVIFSHELGNSHTAGVPYAQELAEHGYAAYVFDFRSGTVGGNQSDAIDPEQGDNMGMSVMTEVSDLDAVISAAQGWDFVDTDKIVLMGGSQGGTVTAVEAAEHPDAAKAVILLYPALSVVDDAHSQFSSESDVPETVNLFGGWMQVGRNYDTDIWDYDVYGTIGNYAGPVLLLHGDSDTTVDISYSERAAEVYSNAEFYEIEGAGHGFSGASFDTAVGYILDFLKKNVPLENNSDLGENTKETSDQTGSTEGTSVSITMNGNVYRAHLNDSAAAQDLISRLPLTITYRQMAGFEEKIGDLDNALDLGDSNYVHDPDPGDIAYWSPQPRIVLYYGDVGAWDGIHVIGSFDEENKEAAEEALSEVSNDFEVTIELLNG